jgi:hypothetical protein
MHSTNKQVTAVVEKDYVVHLGSGLKVQHHVGSDNVYFVFTVSADEKKSSIVWFSATQLCSICEMDLKRKAMAMEPLLSGSIQSSLALVVATNDGIQVVQVCVDETMGLAILQNAHVIYQIPTTCTALSSIALPYSFRFVGQGGMIREFTPPPKVGQVRLLLQQNRFDEAETAAREAPIADQDYSHFHHTEIYLHRLQNVLRNQPSANTMGEAQYCLQRLMQLDSSDLATDNLMTAADYIPTMACSDNCLVSVGTFQYVASHSCCRGAAS